jgi:hypothetical protein
MNKIQLSTLLNGLNTLSSSEEPECHISKNKMFNRNLRFINIFDESLN